MAQLALVVDRLAVLKAQIAQKIDPFVV